MTSSKVFLDLLAGAQAELDEGFAALADSTEAPLPARTSSVLAAAARRMQDNFPYAHPLYAGQMLKPPHVVARAAYAMAMAVNPNNHALDGGRASSRMELEAVAAIAAMFGFPQHLGHLSSGGTFANLEALWVAGQLHPGKGIAGSGQAHYTHARISGVLGLPFHAVAVDERNCMDLLDLERLLETGTIGTVVVTLGTTATGAVDPLDQVIALRKRFDFRIHIDAAYGGYFALASNLETSASLAYGAISHADSIVVDPHKHGLQPYGCGCVLFRDPSVGRLYKHDSPYTYFTSNELHLGEISLECSRAGASAVALWSTQQLFPLVRGDEFARGLEACHQAALQLYELLESSSIFVAPVHLPQLDIVFWTMRGTSIDQSSERAQQVFDAAAGLGLHLALARLPVELFPAETWPAGDFVLCLRSVLMKWDHVDWIGRIFQLLLKAAAHVLTGGVDDTKVPPADVLSGRAV